MVKFTKVSEEQFTDDFIALYGSAPAKGEYEKFSLPKRFSKKDAGHDFFSPVNIVILPGQQVVIPTGVRCFMEDDMVLLLNVRSSMGFKYGLRMGNTIGVIDAGYVDADNEGHIMISLRNDGTKAYEIHEGDRIAQGIIVRYCITDDDCADGVRTGGLGSTGR